MEEIETRICKACSVEKSITQFHKCKNCTQGIVGVCKICKSKGRTVPKDYKVPKFNQKWGLTDGRLLSIQGVSKEDYLSMYEFLKVIGYDVDADVHQQFLDKWNPHVKGKKMKYKRRTDNKSINTYLPNGERNPLKRKTPTD